MSHRKFVGNIGIVAVINILVALKVIVLLPILTKTLTVEHYGIFSQIMISLGLSTPLVTLGLPYALTRFLAAKTHKRDIQEGIYSILIAVFLFSLAASLLFVIFSPFFSNFLKIPPLLLKILSITIIFEALNFVFLNALIAFQKIKTYAFIMLFYIISEIFFVTLSLNMGFGVYGAAFAFLIIRIIAFCFLASLAVIHYGISWPKFTGLKEYLKFGVPTTSSDISYWVLASSDRYIIGLLLGIAFVGYYSPAYAMGNLLNFFIFPFTIVLPAILSKQFDSGDISKVKQYLQYSLKYFLIIAVPAVFGLGILSKQILTLFTTSEIALHSYFVTPFVAASILFYGVYTFFSQIIYLHKKTKFFGVVWGAVAISSILLNILLIPFFGLLAAAFVTLICYILAFFMIYRYSLQYFTFSIDYVAIIKILLASIVMSVGLMLTNPDNVFTLIIAVFWGIFIYSVCTLMLGTIKRRELDVLKGFVFKSHTAQES